MPDTAFFRPDVFVFLRQLKRNNDRDWFAKNKARYQTSIVEPSLSFIREFAPKLEKISPFFVADARPTRGSLFRIYRDTRFSPDKRPFKTHIGIHFSHSSGKDAHAPVFYLHLEPEGCFVAAGIWHPDNQALTKVRTAIVREAEQWAKVRKKLSLEGDRLSRPPRGFDASHPFIAAGRPRHPDQPGADKNLGKGWRRKSRLASSYRDRDSRNGMKFDSSYNTFTNYSVIFACQ